jgi:hypothetical protein
MQSRTMATTAKTCCNGYVIMGVSAVRARSVSCRFPPSLYGADLFGHREDPMRLASIAFLAPIVLVPVQTHSAPHPADDPLISAIQYPDHLDAFIERQEAIEAAREAAAAKAARSAERSAPSVTSTAPTGSVSALPDPWDDLAACESGGNPASVSADGLYHGLFQFLDSTWQAMGGTGSASDASVEEQLQRAQALQAQSGWGPWPVCAAGFG